MMHSYISIDLETTGLNPRWDKITEIGAVKVIDGTVTGTFSTLVNPGRKLAPWRSWNSFYRKTGGSGQFFTETGRWRAGSSL